MSASTLLVLFQVRKQQQTKSPAQRACILVRRETVNNKLKIQRKIKQVRRRDGEGCRRLFHIELSGKASQMMCVHVC